MSANPRTVLSRSPLALVGSGRRPARRSRSRAGDKEPPPNAIAWPACRWRDHRGCWLIAGCYRLAVPRPVSTKAVMGPLCRVPGAGGGNRARARADDSRVATGGVRRVPAAVHGVQVEREVLQLVVSRAPLARSAPSCLTAPGRFPDEGRGSFELPRQKRGLAFGEAPSRSLLRSWVL